MKIILVVFSLFLLANTSEASKASKKIQAAIFEAARDATATSPKDNEACFAPDEPCGMKLVKFIETAKDTLDIAIFEMTDQRIAKAIAEISKTVKVRLVVNPRLFKEKGPSMQILTASKAIIRTGKQRGIMHNKFTLVDGKRLETGSYNYSYGASNANQENQVYLSTPSIVSRYQERFERMWKEAKNTK